MQLFQSGKVHSDSVFFDTALSDAKAKDKVCARVTTQQDVEILSTMAAVSCHSTNEDNNKEVGKTGGDNFKSVEDTIKI